VRIPRVFHQIWVGSAPFPEEYLRYQQTWLEHHPGWRLELWTEESLPDDLVRKEAYERLRQPAERSDIVRLELLERHGGIYLDADFECRRSLEPLLADVEFFVAELKPSRVNNAIIGSVPHHPLLQRAIREVRPRETWGLVDKAGTGPVFLNRLIGDFPDVTVFDWPLFYPRTPDEENAAYAVHKHARSWQDAEGFRKHAEKLERRWTEALDDIARLERERDDLAARLRGERQARWRRRLGRLGGASGSS